MTGGIVAEVLDANAKAAILHKAQPKRSLSRQDDVIRRQSRLAASPHLLIGGVEIGAAQRARGNCDYRRGLTNGPAPAGCR